MRKTVTGAIALVTLLVVPLTAVALSPKSADPAKFQPAQACGCHAALYEQWSVSMHA